MIQDTIDQIKKTNDIIHIHRSNDLMLEQYIVRRDKLMSQLQEELDQLKDFYIWKEWKNR